MKYIKVRTSTEPLRYALIFVDKITHVADHGSMRYIYTGKDSYMSTDESLESIETKLNNL